MTRNAPAFHLGQRALHQSQKKVHCHPAIGANSGPAVFADSFLSVFMGMVVFARFFVFSFCMLNFACVRSFHSPQHKMGIGSCFYCGKHAQNVFVQHAAFCRSFFFLSYPLSSVFVLFFCQLCQLFFHLSLLIIPPSVTPHVSFQSF